MKSHTTERFRQALEDLPQRIQRSARRAYRSFLRDPSHPALQLKKVHATLPIFSARVALGYRALGTLQGDTMVWFWVGSHAEFDRVVAQLRRG